MNEGRQRLSVAVAMAGLILGLLLLASACEARSSVEGAQTAVAAAQTVLPGLQTALPGVQATAQAGATLVSGALGDPQAISAQLKALLAGSVIDLEASPSGVPNEAVQSVDVTGTDAQGTFAQIDARGRQAAMIGALLLLGQYFPNAAISLVVVDSSGVLLSSGTKQPGAAPILETLPD